MTAWYTFDKYYSKTDKTSVYTAAVILYPSCRKQYIRQNWDKKHHKKAFDTVEKLWKTEYSSKVTLDLPYNGPTIEPDVFDLFAHDLDVTASTTIQDKYKAFANDTPFAINGTALNWWLEPAQQKRYPTLWQMAIDILSIPAMSSEPERIFSGARRTISWDRARLGGRNIERTECLKSWIHSNLTAGVGLITQEVVEEVLGDDEVDI
jgi:hypothetical protein